MIGLFKSLLGVDRAPETTRRYRIARCQPCAHRRGARCGLCRCYVNRKAAVAGERCPVGRW